MWENYTGLEEIKQMDKHTLYLGFNNGRGKMFRLSEIQKACPCENCKDNPHKRVDEDVFCRRIFSVGCYALAIEFTSGCSNGVYPYAYLLGLN